MRDLPPTTDTRPELAWLRAQAQAVRPWIVMSAATGLASGVLVVLQARLIADMLHRLCLPGLCRDALAAPLAGLAFAIAGRALLHYTKEAAGFRAGAAVRDRLRVALLERLAAAGPLGRGGHSAGALASAAMEPIEALHGFYSDYLPQRAIALLVPTMIALVILPISWAAAGLLALTAPMIPLFMVLVGMGAQSVSQRHFQALARLSAHFLDRLEGMTTLKLFGGSRQAAAAVALASDAYRRRAMKVLRIAFLSAAVLEFFSCVAIALTAIFLGLSFLGYLGFGTYGRPLDLGDGLFILILAPEFYLPLRELGAHYHRRAEALGAASELCRVFPPAPAPAARPAGRLPPAAAPPALAFEEVGYRHAGSEREVLRGVSLAIGGGEHLALIGESGAGKTTLGHLLLAFDRPSSGRIRVDGEDLARLDPDAWRRRLAWVGQPPFLFHGTLRENIRLGDPQADAAAVAEAARAAGVTAFAEGLPQGLDTEIGERGVGLSVGQAQQVALARAFLKRAPLLVLDEPTAGLDSETEERVMAAIFDFCRGRTLVCMTHRLGRLAAFDRVAVLASGRVVEAGTFAALAAAGGLLARLLARTGAASGEPPPEGR